jgi:Cysteine-rich secretory protein family
MKTTLCALSLLMALLPYQASARASFPSNETTYVLALINAERAAYRLPLVTLSLQSSRCAWRHAKQMAAAGKLYHDRENDICTAHTYAGENVASERIADNGYRLRRAFVRLQAVTVMQDAMFGEGPCPLTPCAGAWFEAYGHFDILTYPGWQKVGIGLYHAHHYLYLSEDFSTNSLGE